MSLHSPVPDDKLKIEFIVFHDSKLLGDKCIGRVEIGVGELLERQRQLPGEGESYVTSNERHST